ncbi:MAG: hypothetical protein IPP32_17535 [Bacteroidetes bacterium]|nr:hypothetical protein [Bacteroidota bacterium]
MKKLYLLIVLLIPFCLKSAAQATSNNWIKYTQSYYKFPITKTGVYRITPTTLYNSGINFSNVHPQNFQLFGRGKEIPIYVKNETDLDGIFNNNDYIEFYAERNDGWLDSLVYDSPGNCTNPYFSLYTDTAYYFLTWNSVFNNPRMQLVGADTSGITTFIPEPYYMQERLTYFKEKYYQGESDVTLITDPEYTKGEGWMCNYFTPGNDKNISFSTANLYPAGQDASLKMNVVAFTNDFQFHENNQIRIELNSTVLSDTMSIGYASFQHNFPIAPALLASGTSSITIKSIAIPGVNNPQSLATAYARLMYPHTFDLENSDSVYIRIFGITHQLKARFDISNFSASSTVFLYDLKDGRRIQAKAVPGGYQILFPNLNNDFEGYLTSESRINYVPRVMPVSTNPASRFTDYANQLSEQADYLLVSHKSLLPEAINYKAYRSSFAGGSHNVVLALSDELYDQYGYGVKRNPIALRKFAEDALKNWGKKASYLFLLGKGITANEFGPQDLNFRYSSTIIDQCLVPSFGYPPSDNLITNHINDSLLFAPAIPTGRLAAATNQDVANYLNKVQQYESATRAVWMKNVLHFGGGNSSNEQLQFSNNLDTYKAILEDTAFGGSIHTFLKTTSAPIQITLSDSVKQLIETGASLMTFFGHASGTSFDQSIDEPSGYNNTGRYPLVVANSCFSGNIHNPVGFGESRINENYVLYPNGGAIGFIAQVGQGISQYLHNYSTNFFTTIGKTDYGKPISFAMKKSVLNIQSNFLYMKALCLEMTLHGDPALVLNAFAKPDYQIESPDIFFTSGIQGNNSITANLDSFFVNVRVNNIAKAIDDSSVIQLKRIFPGNIAPKVYTKVIPGVHYSDVYAFKLPVDRVNGIGLNKFDVIVDEGNVIDELDNSINNAAVNTLNIASGFISPVYPYPFAIVPDNRISLVASTFDPLAPSARYFIQIDTNEAFNSFQAFYRDTTIVSAGGVLKWKVPYILQDSTVYYWRVSRDSTGTHQPIFWKQSSFQYIKNKTGWAQAHFPQFKKDEFKFLNYDSLNRKFSLIPAQKNLFCQTYGVPTIPDLYATSYSIDGQLQESATCGGGFKIQVGIIDGTTLEAWATRFIDTTGGSTFTYNPRHNLGNGNDNNNCPNRYGPMKLFTFSAGDSLQMENLGKSLLDSIPVGNYILAYTWGYANPGWKNKARIFDYFDTLGFAALRTIYGTKPWIYFAKVGDPSSVHVVIGDTGHVQISLSQNMSNSRKSGEIISGLIGPSARWDSLHWQAQSIEQPTNDNIRFRVYGVNVNGQEIILKDSAAFRADMSIQNISAAQYPYLRLSEFTEDDISFTASQLKRWQVIYEEIPEAAVNPLLSYNFESSQVLEGDLVKFKVAIENISNINMDSLLVRFWLVDKNRVIHELKSQRYKKLLAHDTLVASIAFSTLGFDGINTLFMEANPIKTGSANYDQAEQFHFNNFALKEFTATKDKVNPLLDVTFDGVHILDGDLVSAKPAISVQLKDESNYLALDTSVLFKVFIRYPNQNADVLIPFDGASLRFIPAQLPDNRCKVEYSPNLSEDGVYQLIVQARDKSNNRSGDIDYRISFEVVNKSSITEVMNYPNPFSTSTRFVFTLTGSEIPQNFRIQIMTISGKVVREIFQDELGPIHIGRNITQYAWDGKDNFGDQLANGVYFYRTVTKLNSENIEKRETQADGYFKKGWGKMYLLK